MAKYELPAIRNRRYDAILRTHTRSEPKEPKDLDPDRVEECPSCGGEFNVKSMRFARRVKICRGCYKLGPTTVFANIAARAL